MFTQKASNTRDSSHRTLTTKEITVGAWVILRDNRIAKVDRLSQHNGFHYITLYIPALGTTRTMYYTNIAEIIDQNFCQQAQPGDVIQIANVHGTIEQATVLRNLWNGEILMELANGDIETAARSLIVSRQPAQPTLTATWKSLWQTAG